MSIIHIASSSAVRQALTRECPKCHLKQQVSPSDLKNTVNCKKCDSSIPPKGGS